jgi:hypothetical protein
MVYRARAHVKARTRQSPQTDALECPDCGGSMKLIAFIAEETTARRILEHLGLDAAPPPLARAQAPPQQFDPRPVDDVSDPAPAG